MKRSFAISDDEIATVKQTRMNSPPKCEVEMKVDEALDKDTAGAKTSVANRNPFKGNQSRKLVIKNYGNVPFNILISI